MRHFLLYVLLSSPSRIRHSGLIANSERDMALCVFHSIGG
jgi:hypothetical protein